MNRETWLVPWPSWSGRWFGWLARSVIGFLGILFGASLVVLANFGATYKKTVPEWGAEELVFLSWGLVVLGTSLWVFARPSKVSWSVFVLSVIGTLLTGGAI